MKEVASIRLIDFSLDVGHKLKLNVPLDFSLACCIDPFFSSVCIGSSGHLGEECQRINLFAYDHCVLRQPMHYFVMMMNVIPIRLDVVPLQNHNMLKDWRTSIRFPISAVS